ncbi:MAG: hypothetical protein E7037_05560 [Verrucomicrobia bacterium]|nr:hypothetical protein [Verrucomicrobiota bacterium]
MPNREEETKLAGRDENGNELAASIRRRVSDAPMLPADEMQKFAEFLPEANRIILEQTVKEAEFRRVETAKENSRIAQERKLGQIFGFLIGIAGVIGGSCVAISGSAGAGGTIASVSIGTLAVAFLSTAGSSPRK